MFAFDLFCFACFGLLLCSMAQPNQQAEIEPEGRESQSAPAVRLMSEQELATSVVDMQRQLAALTTLISELASRSNSAAPREGDSAVRIRVQQAVSQDDTPLHSGGDASSAARRHTSGRDGSSRSSGLVPTSVKLRDIPKLGKEKDQLPYWRWKTVTMAAIRAAQAAPVIETALTAAASPEYCEWFMHADAVVYAALLSAVMHVPVLSDSVLRLEGTEGSARLAWEVVKAYYVRLADSNIMFLTGKLQALRPREKESMESFLCRCVNLQREYEQYGLVLDDTALNIQVFSVLSHQWKQSCGLSRVSASAVAWSHVAEVLQAEDNSRRQSDTTAHDALFPLGWTKREKGIALHVGEHSTFAGSPGVPRSSAPFPIPIASPAGGWKQGGQKGKGDQHKIPKVRIVVCYFCKKAGHVCSACRDPSKPAGWQPTAEDKAEADRIILQRVQQGQRDRAALAAHGGEAGGSYSQPGTPSQGRVSDPSC